MHSVTTSQSYGWKSDRVTGLKAKFNGFSVVW